MRWTKESRSAKQRRQAEQARQWHEWFAWKPTQIDEVSGDQSWVWLEKVYRRMLTSGGGQDGLRPRWEYCVDEFEMLKRTVQEEEGVSGWIGLAGQPSGSGFSAPLVTPGYYTGSRKKKVSKK